MVLLAARHAHGRDGNRSGGLSLPVPVRRRGTQPPRAVPARGARSPAQGGFGPQRGAGEKSALHRPDPRHAHVSVARGDHRPRRPRAAGEQPRLPARVETRRRRRLVGAAGQDFVGVVAFAQYLRGRFPLGGQHRDLQVLHRFRGQIRHRLHPAGRRVVREHAQYQGAAPGDRPRGADPPRPRKGRRRGALDALEPHEEGPGRHPGHLPRLGREGHQDRLHAAVRSGDGPILR